MLIIGCDFHTRYQQIAMMDQSTGELVERRLEHENGEASAFYRSLPGSAHAIRRRPMLFSGPLGHLNLIFHELPQPSTLPNPSQHATSMLTLSESSSRTGPSHLNLQHALCVPSRSFSL